MITKKSEITSKLAFCIATYKNSGLKDFTLALHNGVLNHKIRFPLLEFCAYSIQSEIPESQILLLCDQIHSYRSMGGNVIIGILLQNRLNTQLKESFSQASFYISQADAWYICDIIGERVFGYGMRHYPEIAIPIIYEMMHVENRWVIRSIGAGSHYAIKKGLDASHVATIFQMLLTKANDKDKEIRQGMGWAAKTTAKFHPSIITRFQTQIKDEDKVANWFRRKIKIGLERNQYVKNKVRQIRIE